MSTANVSAREWLDSGRVTPEVSPMLNQSITPSVYGDPRMPPRFWNKIQVGWFGCWLWTASLNHAGYAHQSWGKRGVDFSNRIHRIAYKEMVGPIPEGLTLDHLCRIRRCVRPDHLEPVTQVENIRRARRTHCLRGHLRDRPGKCRTCHAEETLKRRAHLPRRNKLTPDDVRAIRQLIADGCPLIEIARGFGVARCSIQNIKKGTGWKTVS